MTGNMTQNRRERAHGSSEENKRQPVTGHTTADTGHMTAGNSREQRLVNCLLQDALLIGNVIDIEFPAFSLYIFYLVSFVLNGLYLTCVLRRSIEAKNKELVC